MKGCNGMAVWVGLVLLLSAGAIVWQARVLSRCRFWCRSCGRLFVLPWTRLLFRQHVNDEWRLVCPHCGRKGWCPARRAAKGEEK